MADIEVPVLIVGSSLAGVCEMRRISAFGGGSSRIFRSALAASVESSSAGSMMATRQGLSAPVSRRKSVIARMSSTLISL